MSGVDLAFNRFCIDVMAELHSVDVADPRGFQKAWARQIIAGHTLLIQLYFHQVKHNPQSEHANDQEGSEDQTQICLSLKIIPGWFSHNRVFSTMLDRQGLDTHFSLVGYHDLPLASMKDKLVSMLRDSPRNSFDYEDDLNVLNVNYKVDQGMSAAGYFKGDFERISPESLSWVKALVDAVRPESVRAAELLTLRREFNVCDAENTKEKEPERTGKENETKEGDDEVRGEGDKAKRSCGSERVSVVATKRRKTSKKKGPKLF